MLTRILENWPYKLAALLIAVALRVYVEHVDDPQTTNQITIPLTLTDIPTGLVESSATPTVTLEVSGSASSLDSVTGTSYVATADLRDAKAGVNQPIPIRVAAAPGVSPDVTVESQVPKEASVTMENFIRRSLAVHVSFRKIAPAGLSYGNPTVVPPVATVEGPQYDMERVARLVVYGDDAVTGEISSPGMLDGFGSIVALDAQQNPVTEVDVVPIQADVRIPVTRESAAKQLIVNASVAGTPDYPTQVTGVDVQPNRVTVVGVPDLLAATSTVDTEPVDITGATTDVQRIVSLNLPNGLATILPVSVTVTVHIRAGAAAPTTAVQRPHGEPRKS